MRAGKQSGIGSRVSGLGSRRARAVRPAPKSSPASAPSVPSVVKTSGSGSGARPKSSLIQPGVAEVTCDGVLHVAGADLDYADLGGACSLYVNVKEHRLTVRHGNNHRIAVAGSGGRGLIDAHKELKALRVRVSGIGYRPGKSAIINYQSSICLARVVRHSDGHSRWLEVRFDADAIKEKTLKNKAISPQSAPRARRSN